MNGEPKMTWGFAGIWNKTLETREERFPTPREHIWAGEMGGGYLDRYLKMKGIIPSNPHTPRTLRKFEAGNLMEWVVELILIRAGILKRTQEWVAYQYPTLLRVTGKLDFLAGGNPDWTKSKEFINSMNLPEFFSRASGSIIEYLSAAYPNGLKHIILETKSVSAMMWDRYEATGGADNHKMQIFHYLKAKDMHEGHLVYVSKDDLRIGEYGIYNPSPVERMYRADIEAMTEYVRSQTDPPMEQEILFDTDTGKFSKNWKVEYSAYLTMLYGYKTAAEYDEKYKKRVSQWNRVAARWINGAKMTAKNLDIILDIKTMFPDFDKQIELIRMRGIKVEEEPEEVNGE